MRRVPAAHWTAKAAPSKCCSAPPLPATSPTITARRFQGWPSPSSLLWKNSERSAKLHGVHSQKNWLKLPRSEEHTSELQSLMRISYAVFCLTKKTKYSRTTLYPFIVHHHHIAPYQVHLA